MRGRFTIPILAATLALVSSAAQAAGPRADVVTDGPVKLTATVDKPVARVAEPIRLTLEVDAPRGTQVQMPQLAGRLGEFEVRSSERANDVPAADNAGARRWVFETTLETIKTGALTIPPLDVHYAAAGQTSFKTLHTRPIPVRVTSVLENRADPTKFRDIKDAVDVAVPEVHSYAWLGWTAAGAGGAVALGLLALVATRRKRGPSAAEWALAEIEDLEQLPIATAADAEALYNELVDIVREFFAMQFGVPTLSRTTCEFLAQAAQEVGLGEISRQRLASLASLADEIKFARLGVGEEQVRHACDGAKAFVTECQQRRQAMEQEVA
jgi:BatD DUF11 like domain